MFDVIIIGGGSAGLKTARLCRKEGLTYKIVHSGFKGTTCAHHGCMPSKVLIQVAKSYHERTKFDAFGLTGADHIHVDMPAVMDHVRSLRDYFVSGIVEDMNEDEHLIEGAAKFVARDTIEVNGEHLQAQYVVISTGASPNIPAVFEPYKDDLLTTDNIFEQTDFPSHVAIIGLGNIAAELGQALGRLGVKITAINKETDIARLNDGALKDVAHDILSKDMDIILGTDISRVDHKNDGYEIAIGEQIVKCDKILVAAGQTPHIQNLGLDNIEAVSEGKNMPQLNEKTLKIKEYPIYLAGDVNARHALLHEAQDEVDIIMADILGKDNPGRRVPLSITFTDPVIAHIGQMPDDINEEFLTGFVSFNDQGRARVKGENQGRLEIYISKNSKRILGSVLMAPAGEHLAHLIALAIQNKMTVAAFLELPFYHPTIEEGLRTALQSIHDPNDHCVTDRLC